MLKDEVQDPISLCVIDDIRSVVEGLTAISWTDYGISPEGLPPTVAMGWNSWLE